MARNKIKTNLTFSIDGIPLQKGVAVDVMTYFFNPFNEMDYIKNTSLRNCDIDYKSSGFVIPCQFKKDEISINQYILNYGNI